MMMTFQEAYGTMPMNVWRKVKAANVSPADYDQILHSIGRHWSDGPTMTVEQWDTVRNLIDTFTVNGMYRPSRYL